MHRSVMYLQMSVWVILLVFGQPWPGQAATLGSLEQVQQDPLDPVQQDDSVRSGEFDNFGSEEYLRQIGYTFPQQGEVSEVDPSESNDETAAAGSQIDPIFLPYQQMSEREQDVDTREEATSPKSVKTTTDDFFAELEDLDWSDFNTSEVDTNGTWQDWYAAGGPIDGFINVFLCGTLGFHLDACKNRKTDVKENSHPYLNVVEENHDTVSLNCVLGTNITELKRNATVTWELDNQPVNSDNDGVDIKRVGDASSLTITWDELERDAEKEGKPLLVDCTIDYMEVVKYGDSYSKQFSTIDYGTTVVRKELPVDATK